MLEKAFYKSKVCSLRVLSVKTEIAHMSCYSRISQILELNKGPSKKIVRQTHFAIELRKEAVNKQIKYGNATIKRIAVPKMPERWAVCGQSKRGYLFLTQTRHNHCNSTSSKVN